MTTKYTTGPWTMEYDYSLVMAGQVVAVTIAPDGASLEEQRANAQLIAAAPDLLDALNRLSFAAECRDNTMGDACRLIEVKAELAAAKEQAIAAIAKATA